MYIDVSQSQHFLRPRLEQAIAGRQPSGSTFSHICGSGNIQDAKTVRHSMDGTMPILETLRKQTWVFARIGSTAFRGFRVFLLAQFLGHFFATT